MKAIIRIGVSGVALAYAGAAFAQAAPTAAARTSADPQATTEIVVTAERRATNLQRTSVAATVLTSQDLVNKSVRTIDQLQFATPSMTVANSGQGNTVNIRGIGQTERGSAFQSGVVTYRDGVATFPGYFQSEPYYDLASVEVLRGPQGTFAGGNATGGAIFITEANPTLDKIGGYATAQYGNYNDMKFEGALNLPVSDTLALRVATSDERRDTFYHITGPWTGNPGNLRSYSGRASLLWQPTSQLRVLVKGDYSNVEQGGYPGDPADPTQRPAGTDLFHITSNAYLNGRDEFGRIVANISYTTDGGVVLRSISGFQKGTVQTNYDYDGTSTGISTLADKISERIWSQEVNIISPSTGRFTWLLGGYYQNDKITIPDGGGYVLRQPLSASLPIPYDTVIVGTNPKTAIAAFGQLGYQLTDALQVTLGGRWSRTTSRNDAVVSSPQLGLALPQHDFVAYHKVNGKLALNWTLNPHNFLYAFAATGTKAGGLNSVNLYGVPPKPFKPEDVTDFEIGWKATLLDGHLRTQLGGYYNRYKNFQITIVDPNTPLFNSITNVGKPTHIYGAEFSAQGSFGHFGLDFAASVSHTKVGTFYAFDPRLAHSGTCDPTTGPASATGCIDLGGRAATYAPKFTLSTGAQYEIPLNDRMTLTPRMDFSHTSGTWATLFEDAPLGDRLSTRNLVNAQLTLASGPWSAAGYATNLTNQHYVAALNLPRRIAGPPRQYGIRISRSF
ncbi:TonB-dependent receptor [Sphingomonas oryzagri]|uniref:TonB-dependent receptor n=1 Tax=Sphingomonas oryzagri TaxID=3042314 RepID=A0ABT6N201_9SPHN|nr:TonB-dependent receptor [Sphingomonas oryzagri]MDH7639086.1 TonB-dependent receptor [Sphingomonas oryzagri]